jgi:hypothetical protein
LYSGFILQIGRYIMIDRLIQTFNQLTKSVVGHMKELHTKHVDLELNTWWCEDGGGITFHLPGCFGEWSKGEACVSVTWGKRSFSVHLNIGYPASGSNNIETVGGDWAAGILFLRSDWARSFLKSPDLCSGIAASLKEVPLQSRPAAEALCLNVIRLIASIACTNKGIEWGNLVLGKLDLPYGLSGADHSRFPFATQPAVHNEKALMFLRDIGKPCDDQLFAEINQLFGKQGDGHTFSALV